MIHCALRWPECSEKELWPLAIDYGVYLYNHMPSKESGKSPVEIWSGSKSSYSSLTNSHPWGCPVYILDPKLQDGQKIPKWRPISRLGQFMGVSKHHASTVGLVRNLQTGRIIPQFHVIYDDDFETVRSDEESQPLIWEELLTFNTFKSDYSAEINIPQLEKEWLETDEISHLESEINCRNNQLDMGTKEHQNAVEFEEQNNSSHVEIYRKQKSKNCGDTNEDLRRSNKESKISDRLE